MELDEGEMNRYPSSVTRLMETYEDVAVAEGSIGIKIEYLALDPTAKIQDVREACETARNRGYACIAVAPWLVGTAIEFLEGSNVAVSTPVGLPGGATSTHAKYAEVREAVKNGASEVDVPLNMRLIREGRLDEARNDLNEATAPARGRARVKAVIEVGALNEEQKEAAIKTALCCNVDYLTLSNVMGKGRVAAVDIDKALTACAGKAKLKIMGSIGELGQARELVSIGVERVATSRAL